MTKYGCVYADPPWKLSGGKNGKGGWSKTASPDAHYSLMKTKDIAEMFGTMSWAKDDAHLWLWVPNCMLPDGLEVMRAWGFRYSNNVAWNKTGAPGLGQRIRTMHELCLLGLRGRTSYAKDPGGKRVQIRSSFVAPRGRHSAKPPEFREMIQRVSPGPYIELFARERVAGWDAWGNEASGAIILPPSVV